MEPSTSNGLAVVTGASSGIGLELATQLAAARFDLVVAAEDAAIANVARAGFGALVAGEERVVAGSLATKAQGHGSRLMPDKAKAEMHRRMAEPESA